MTSSTRTNLHMTAAFGVGTIGLLIAIWVFLGLQGRLGLDTEPTRPVLRTGTADVRSCTADALAAWMTYRCDADLRWEGEKNTVSTRFRSTHPATGTIDVQLRGEGTSRSGQATSKLVAADYPHRNNGFLFFALMIAIPGTGFILGTTVGHLLGKLLPKPKPDKLVLMPFRANRRRGNKR